MAASLRSASAFFRDPVGYATRSSGDLVELAAPTGRFALVRDPGEIWRVLVTDADRFRQGKWKGRARRFLGATLNTLDGEEHRRRRMLLREALDRRRVLEHAPAMAERAERAQASWRDGDRLDLRTALDPLSLAMAGDVLFSTDLGPQAPELAAALADVMAAIPGPIPPLPRTRRTRTLARVHAAVASLLDERRRLGFDQPDLLGLLLASDLPEHAVVGEVTAFLLAAVDEPPSGLAAAWYLLGRHVEAEARFHAELAAVLGDRPPMPADELPYLDAVLQEALRLYPPARHIDRCPRTDARVAGSEVRAGTNLIVSPLVTHRDPRLYERPSDFVPERWLGASGEGRARGAYIPFGAGPHTCIGEPLARLVMRVTLATIGRRWRLRIDGDTQAPVPRAARLVVTLEAR